MAAVVYSPVPEPYSRNGEHLEFGEDMANVTVMGGVHTEGGLKEAQAVQRRHNAEVADALLNISGVGTANGQPVHKDDIRKPYVHQDFPMMLYKETEEKVVLHEAEKKQALAEGWRVEPFPKVQIAVLDPAMEKKNLLDTNNQLQAQLVRQQELMEKMAARLESLEGRKKLA